VIVDLLRFVISCPSSTYLRWSTRLIHVFGTQIHLTIELRARPWQLNQQRSCSHHQALAGIVSRTVVSPLEVVATVNMCSTGASRPLLIELRALFAAEGFRGFFKGNAANCLKVAPTKGIQFVAFEAFKRFIHSSRKSRCGEDSGPIRPYERLAAGGAAGMAAAAFCYPLEVAKTLLTAHPERYHGVFGTLSSVVRTSGLPGLYRGLLPTLIAMFPYVGLEFMVYEQLKLMYTRRTGRESNVFHMLLIGAFAGSLAQTTCHPLDVVRKRLQLQGIGGRPIQYRSMIDATLSIVRQEGPNALWRGLQPMYVSVLPSAGVSYVVYETTKNALGVTSFR
jgi:solute carrier family 25 (mitochondrial phosphate transporter), member 23/24/25/41